MIQYFDDYDLACVDGYSFRRDKKTGYYLSSKKINGKRKRLHVYIWEKQNGRVPKGMTIHHIDEDKRNNELTNLKLITNKEHAKLHGETMSEERRQWLADNVVKSAMPAAKSWHSTDEGKSWHSQHMKETMSKAKSCEYTCDNCGSVFSSRRKYSEDQRRFCCNKCRSAYRRKLGVDDVVKICQSCGKEYLANKYQKTKYCIDCRKVRKTDKNREL